MLKHFSMLDNRKVIKQIARTIPTFVLSSIFGYGLAKAVDIVRLEVVTASADSSWGLSFQEEDKPLVASTTSDYLKQFSTHHANQADREVIHLTFDAGLENGNTLTILDAFKKHHVPATFFVVGNYISTSPDLVKRVMAEGHTVGNHTYRHPDISKISTQESFAKELQDLEKLYQETTGQTVIKFYRSPQGKYSESSLKMTNDLDCHTFLWSLAYMNWYEDKQPIKEEAFKKLLGRIHPGVTVLLHSTSKTNEEILDKLLTRWGEMGYQFESLDELMAKQGRQRGIF